MTDIPDDAYAIIFNGDGKIELVIPAEAKDEYTDGRLLLLGLLQLMKQPNWANAVIENMANTINEIQSDAH